MPKVLLGGLVGIVIGAAILHYGFGINFIGNRTAKNKHPNKAVANNSQSKPEKMPKGNRRAKTLQQPAVDTKKPSTPEVAHETSDKGDQKPVSEVKASPKVLSNSIGMKLALIPSGTFKTGDGVKVTISHDFYLGVYEATQAEYIAVMGKNPSKFKNGGQYPVEMVSWHDAAEFCRKLSVLPKERAEGRAYRLPTEAEWEYACRAGTTTRFSFGDNEVGDYVWYRTNSDKTTHPVGRKKPNPWGLYDMHGNVWEFCQDLYHPNGPMAEFRVIRGGSWYDSISGCWSGSRLKSRPTYRGFNLGFRVVQVRL